MYKYIFLLFPCFIYGQNRIEIKVPYLAASYNDSTTIIGGWGITALESPKNTWNIVADTSQVATQYDLTQITSGGGGVDSTVITQGFGVIVTESPVNQYNIKSDTTKMATLYDLLQVDQSATNELQTISTNGGAGNITLSNGGGTLNLNVNDADASTTNELQTLSHTSTSTNHTMTLSNSGGSLILTEGANVTLTTSGNNVTIASTASGGTNSTVSEGFGINVVQSGNDYNVSADTSQLATPYDLSLVDQSTTNEIQTLSNSATATSHTVTLSNSGGTFTMTEGANISFNTSGNNVTIAASGGANTVSEGYGIDVVQTGSDYNVKADTAQLATQFDLLSYLSGSGVSTRPAIWTGTNTLGSTAELDWNNSLNILKIGSGSTQTVNRLLVSGTPASSTPIGMFETKGTSTGATILSLNATTTSSNSIIALTSTANTAATLLNTITNNNSAGGNGALRIYTNGTSSNSYIELGKSGSTIWTMGYKQSESYGGRFTLSESSTFTGTGERFSVATGGVVRIKGLDTDLTPPVTSGTTRMVISDANGDLSFTNIPSSNLSGSGTANYLPYWTGSTSFGTTSISYGSLLFGLGFNVAPSSVTHALHLNNESIRLQGTASIVDRLNSGGGSNEVLSGTGGSGVEWKSLSTLGADMSTTNEIQSLSTNGSAGNISISGGNTITLNVDDSDASQTNEGYLGISSGGANDALLRGYNGSGTATGTGVTINGGQGIAITETTPTTNGGTIQFDAMGVRYAQLYNTGNLLSQTIDATDRNVDFSSASSNVITTTAGDDLITIPTTGTYRVSYSCSFVTDASSTSTQFNIKINGATKPYFLETRQTNEASIGVPATYMESISKTGIYDFTANDTVGLTYRQLSGSATLISIYNVVMLVERIK
jgi:hypothetical protein